ncbi:MAG: IS66 family transposase, partial [Candidatus Omnitrophica bacterium]|nr:IS66 family transposase [Candidatus Omnitrophota bacterium]
IAPAPVKLIPKGMFSTDLWVHILSEKFLFQRPMSRTLQTLALEGLDISQGTITGGLEKIKEMVYPLYTRILEKSRAAKHWHMDETRWMMFVTVEGKTGYRWWLWVVITKDTVVYILDPSRSAAVPKDHLPDNPKGIISADRYSAYKALITENLQIAFCWGHVRRDYINIYDARKKLRSWAEKWIDHINKIFHLNKQRLGVLSEEDKFSIADRTLRDALQIMEQNYENELNLEDLHPVKRKVLKSLKTHWTGLLLFVDHPEIPMDNNLSERKLREPALGRKNYYGCAALWSGDLTASLFTIFQTARLNKLHPKKYLKNYLQACAENGGKPPENIDDFLPWNLSEEQKQAWQYPKKPPP